MSKNGTSQAITTYNYSKKQKFRNINQLVKASEHKVIPRNKRIKTTIYKLIYRPTLKHGSKT